MSSRRKGREEALAQLSEARSRGDNVDIADLRYRTTIGTLMAVKRKVRVPPHESGIFNYDKFKERRYQEKRGVRLEFNSPPNYPYGCEPDCETCFTQHFPARISVSDSEALKAITGLTSSINSDLEFLHQALRMHADFLVSRWKKKSQAKRLDFLNSLSQGTKKSSGFLQPRGDGISLHEKKWAAIHLISDRTRETPQIDPKQLLKGSEFAKDPYAHAATPHFLRALNCMEVADQMMRYQTSWLLPYLDEETLAGDPLVLLSLLHYRTGHTPVGLLTSYD
ncbi:uncharacterized protein LTR77_000624 [Saxophila tyrrhenica]|uniref:Uncharacterized protein n=1 Tax=Saxophila tyrrhenica TaxID=1690608 RepID=A0AAV9PPT2_9PEZI|nr:hypothetical protein LTR77_000624 [Saxophila tyrrhenica]